MLLGEASFSDVVSSVFQKNTLHGSSDDVEMIDDKPEISRVEQTVTSSVLTSSVAFSDNNELAKSTADGPLDKLPIELLICIFSFCIADDPDIAATLSLVNRHWRTIMTELPSLWNHLRLSDERFDPTRLRAKAELWLQRIGKLPLDIDLDTRSRDSVLPLLSFALRGAARWRRVSYLHSRMRFLTVKDGEEPRLESLLVTLAPKKAMGSDLQLPPPPQDDATSTRTWWGGRDVPLVKNFKADDERLREMYILGVRCLPPPGHLAPFDSVTSLVLMNASTECDFPMHRAVPFLTAFPSLQSLELTNFNELYLVHDPEYRPDCVDLQPAELKELRRLSVRGICSSRCILSHLRAPKLQILVLIHINSSSVFDHPTPGEPGDSEDEAHDFSRSPWTDHATGMGLRKLLGGPKGASELKELIMDYADLRTKDFIWLFARLPKLEKFTIVASDISDNVMRAMEIDVPDFLPHPQLYPDSSLLDGGGDAEEYRKSRSSVAVSRSTRAARPPVLRSLTRLKFSKCQKMTGDAVVCMIRSRVRAAERGLVARFEELSTTECLQVTDVHHHELQSFFPREARLIYAPGVEEDE